MKMNQCDICKKEKSEEEVLVLKNPQSQSPVTMCEECYEEKRDSFTTQAPSFEEVKKMYENHNRGQAPVDAKKMVQNLNEVVKESYDPVLFRDLETQRLIQILSRKTKNNAIIIGEAGVGKTALAYSLAYGIVNRQNERFSKYTVLSLSIASMMSGTKYRGELETKFEALLESIKGQKSILFIDEIHLLVGAGAGSENSIDIANLLKPYLTNGDLKVVGATTLDEYKAIEKDPAFSRRFQPIHLKPLDKEQTLTVLHKIVPDFEKHHGVNVETDGLELIVDLADNYINDRHFPDKAIDILDEVCSFISVKNNGHLRESNKGMKEALTANVRNFFEVIHQGPDFLKTIEEVSEESMNDENYKVKLKDIMSVVEKMTGIPVSKLTVESKKNLSQLETKLREKLIGQDTAVETLSKVVKRSQMKIKKQIKKPTVLFFAGPTGVGKTESAKVLAKTLFGNENSMIRIDMSEYMEAHSLSKLIGTAPGYVGYEKDGELTEKVRRNPYSIVLLDEFEKAHTDVSNIFLQLFDDGRLTDSKGRTVDFRNTIIIITSNVGTSEKMSMGFGSQAASDNKTMDALRKMYRPEFLNRIDEIITFNKLTEEDLLQIVDLMIAEYITSLDSDGIELSLDEEAKKYLASKGYDSTMGARPLQRLITREVEDLVVDYLLENEEVTKVSISNIDDQLEIV